MRRICLFVLVCTTAFFASCKPGQRDISSGTCKSPIASSSSDAVAQTAYGKVVGYLEDNLYIFKGIPYAQAERFMPPVPPTPWENVRSSRSYGPTCPQAKRTGWLMDEQAFAFKWDDGYPGEDCLRLNIWTQGLADGKKRAVMVWFHGGGYSAGSGNELPSYDGAALASKGDVVLVTVNHRLNVLGFLDLSAFGKKYEQSGNAGILDLVAALQWVHDNIANFGGDPGNVTIFGQSGGGGKTSTILAVPAAKGLFHKAIVQSGSTLKVMEQENSRRIGVEVLNILKIKPSEIDKIKDVPYDQLLAAGNEAIEKVRKEATSSTQGGKMLMFGWSPTVDGITLTQHPFSPQAPDQIKDIPMLIGTTLHEFMGSNRIPDLDKKSDEEVKALLKEQYGDKTDAFLNEFKKVYPEYKTKDLFDVDLRFRPGAVEQASIKYAQGGAPVYMYLFAWESPALDGKLRSMHCMELPFVFNNISRTREMTGGGEEAYQLADKVSSAWINFAKTGNPNAEGLPEWEPFNPENGATMIFNNICEIKHNHDKELLNIVNK